MECSLCTASNHIRSLKTQIHTQNSVRTIKTNLFIIWHYNKINNLLTRQQTDVRGLFQDSSLRHWPASTSHKHNLPSFEELICNRGGPLVDDHMTLVLMTWDQGSGHSYRGWNRDLPHSRGSKHSRWSSLCDSEGVTWTEQQETHSRPTTSEPVLRVDKLPQMEHWHKNVSMPSWLTVMPKTRHF